MIEEKSSIPVPPHPKEIYNPVLDFLGFKRYAVLDRVGLESFRACPTKTSKIELGKLLELLNSSRIACCSKSCFRRTHVAPRSNSHENYLRTHPVIFKKNL